MSTLRPFKEVQLQWLRLLVADTDLSPRAVQFATYLAVVRYNAERGKAWPSHRTVCKDLGLKSEKTIQRLIKELQGKWFEIKHGNGLKHSTEYVPSKASHEAAQKLREDEEAEKPGKIVHLRSGKAPKPVAGTQTNLSKKDGQECPTKKEQEKTINPGLEPDLPDGGPSGSARGGGAPAVFVSRQSFGCRQWEQFTERMFGAWIDRALPETIENGERGYWLPAKFPPTNKHDWPEWRSWLINSGWTLFAPSKQELCHAV